MSSKRSVEILEDSENGVVKRTKPSGANNNAKHPLRRAISAGMNPVTLLTSYYGARGERIRHVVHEGAMRLPQDALDLCAQSSSPSANDFTLPELDSVARPTVDSQRRSVIVTDLTMEMVDGDQEDKQVLKTVAKNRVILLEEDPMRIRGGGGGDNADSESKEVPEPANSSDSIPDAALSLLNAPLPVPAPATGTASENPVAALVAVEPVNSVASQQMPPEEVAVINGTGETQPSVPIQATLNAAVTSGITTPLQDVVIDATAVPSTANTPAPIPQVVGLPKKPTPAWEQHMPGPNDEMTIDPTTTSPKPEWFKQDQVSTLERSLLPEWFDGSSSHRTEQSYLQTRAKFMEMSDRLGTRYLTATMLRRSVPGDVGSLMRLHAFLSSYNLINEHSLNDSAPLPVSMQQPTDTKKDWDEPLKEKLLEAIVKEAQDSQSINWRNVSKAVGYGKKPAECEQQFLSMPIPEEAVDGSAERSITPDTYSIKHHAIDKHLDAASLSQILQQLVANTEPNVISSVTTAALTSTRNNLTKTQQAVAVGLAVSHAEQVAELQEKRVGAILSEIVELRMRKLENRLTLLDDVEGMLEAERAALELERRDLYTARCRHWFQGP